MSLFGLLLLLLIAAVCGSIGQTLAGYSLGGCLVSIVVGFIGAYIGMWLAAQFGLPEPWLVNIEGHDFPVLWSILGSTLFALVLGLVRRNWSSPPRNPV